MATSATSPVASIGQPRSRTIRSPRCHDPQPHHHCQRPSQEPRHPNGAGSAYFIGVDSRRIEGVTITSAPESAVANFWNTTVDSEVTLIGPAPAGASWCPQMLPFTSHAIIERSHIGLRLVLQQAPPSTSDLPSAPIAVGSLPLQALQGAPDRAAALPQPQRQQA